MRLRAARVLDDRLDPLLELADAALAFLLGTTQSISGGIAELALGGLGTSFGLAQLHLGGPESPRVLLGLLAARCGDLLLGRVLGLALELLGPALEPARRLLSRVHLRAAKPL